MGLPFELRLKSLGAPRVSLRPYRRVILDLFFDHRVEDDRDFVGRGPVDSMAAVVIPQLTSHCAIFCKSSVKVENTRTGCSSRSGGTATKISLAPISIPAAFGSSMGRSSRHIPVRFPPLLPGPAAGFSFPVLGECFFGLDMPVILSAQVEAKSRISK